MENFVKKKYVLASGREKWRMSTEERGGNLVQIRSSISVGNLNIMRNNVSGMSQIYIYLGFMIKIYVDVPQCMLVGKCKKKQWNLGIYELQFRNRFTFL